MKIIVGIDPDTVASGVAIMNLDTQKIEVNAMPFFDLFRFMQFEKNNIVTVYIESGWLNAKSNYHGNANQSKAVGELIAKKVGANHETGRKIVEMCEYLQIDYKLIKPTKSKVTPAYFEKLTGIKLKAKDQDMIDSAMLIIGRTY